MFIIILIIVTLSLIVDFINLYGIKKMMRRLKGSGIYGLFIKGYWAFSIGLFVFFIAYIFYIGNPETDYEKYRSFFLIFGIYALIYLPRIDFLFFVLWQLFYYKIKSIISPGADYIVQRSKRRSYFIQKMGLFVSLLSFLIIIYGLIWGKSDFIARNSTVYFNDLPLSFDGFRIAHISDTHLGSFSNIEDVYKGLDLLVEQNVDIVLFTGDMVNNVADEMDNYIQKFKDIRPPFGKYAILGNHDKSDYIRWENKEIKEKEMRRIYDKEVQMGFEMLLNESDIIYRNGDSIAILGVENWGKPPFKQYGNLKAALSGVENVPFKILLSHDPNHFNMQVKDKTNIQLTLSGHTHGMQVGINCCGIKWSPISFVYQQWNGLYQFGQQYLYVNPGFGFIGLPARIGIRPEISVITLKRN